MLEPPLSTSNDDLDNQITQRMLQDQLDQQILQVVKQGFERVLNSTTMIVSRPQRVRLYNQVDDSFLTQIIHNLDRIE